MKAARVTVSTTWIKSILNFAGQQGVDTEAILASLNLDAQLLERAGARFSIDDTVRIWQACAEACGDPCFGLRFGQRIRPGSLHIVGYTLMNSATLGDALERLQRYQRLISDGGMLHRIPSARGIWLVYRPRPERLPFCDHQIDAVMAAVLTLSRVVTGRDLVPLEVSFQRPRLEPVEAYECHFRCPLVTGGQFDGILVSRDLLELPLLEADTELCRLHENHALHRLRLLHSEDSWQSKTEALIEQHLADPAFGRAAAASLLGLSERSLQRKLAEEETSFQELLDRIRQRRAMEYLADSQRSLAEVGEALGFSDISAFYRAFKRWTGRTPGDFRLSG